MARGTRTRTGRPGADAWVQHPRYDIDARLDPEEGRVHGSERVLYRNASPDTLTRLAVHLRQNVFAPGSPRRQPAPITGGVALERVAIDGRAWAPEPPADPGQPITASPPGPPHPGRYAVQGTVMWVALSRPARPG